MIAIGIDAGGTSTRARIRRADGSVDDIALGTASPFALDSEDDALAVWSELAGRVAAEVGGEPVSIVVGSAAHSENLLAFSERVAAALLRPLAETSRVVILNDVVPLLYGPPLAGVGVAVIAGTGSAVLARSADGRTAYALGLEWLLSDSGSAYAIGRAGLRAAVAASQGIAPPTDLERRAEEEYGCDLAELARRLAADPEQKPKLAAFARHVDEAAEAGDAVALDVLRHEAEALAHAIVRCAALVGSDRPHVVANGSLVAKSDTYQAAVLAALGDRVGEVTVVTDALDACVALAADPPADFGSFPVVRRP